MPKKRCARLGPLGIVFALTLMLGASCEIDSAPVTGSESNPFCVLVGPPPAGLIPDPGSPAGWVDDYLAVYTEVCQEGSKQ